MIENEVPVFLLSDSFGGNNHSKIRYFREDAAGMTAQPDNRSTMLHRVLTCSNNVPRVSRARYRDEHVTWEHKIPQWLDEYGIEVNVIRVSGDEWDVISQGNGAQSFCAIESRELTKIVHHMRRGRCASTVADKEDGSSGLPDVH